MCPEQALASLGLMDSGIIESGEAHGTLPVRQ
jgi:hypothetical protein